MLYCPNFFWNVLQVWMTGKDVYLQMTWSWPDKTWNILCSYCLQWNTSQSKFINHYFLFLFAFSILSQLFLIWGCIYFLLSTVFLFIFTHNITNTTSTQTNKTKQQTHTQYFKSPVKRNRERERKRKTKQVIPEDGAIQSRILNMSLVSGHRK